MAYLHNTVSSPPVSNRKWHCLATRTKNSLLGNCCLTRQMCFNNLPITSTEKALLTLCLSGTNSLWIVSCLSKNVISMVLILDFYKQNFLGLGDNFEFCCMLWHFVSGSYWIRMIHPQLQCNEENWDYLDEISAWCESPLLLLVCESAWDELAQILLFRKSLWRRIWRIASLLMFSSSHIILRAHRRSRVVTARAFVIVSTCRDAEGRPPLIILKILAPVFKCLKPFK
jgi:hypothetical protein